jgi:hypothetical protein
MTGPEPPFEKELADLLAKHDLTELDGLMNYHGYFDELPLFAQDAEVAFLDELPPAERNRVLIRAAAGHLDTILEHSRAFYAGRDYDYFCAVTVTGWEYAEDGEVVVPRFWYANPSHGVFDHARIGPPDSPQSRFVAECLDHSPRYLLGDDVVRDRAGDRLERVFVCHTACPPPPGFIRRT